MKLISAYCRNTSMTDEKMVGLVLYIWGSNTLAPTKSISAVKSSDPPIAGFANQPLPASDSFRMGVGWFRVSSPETNLREPKHGGEITHGLLSI